MFPLVVLKENTFFFLDNLIEPKLPRMHAQYSFKTTDVLMKSRYYE